MRDDPVFPEGTGGGKVVRTETRFTVDGLEDLRVLMDALLPKVFGKDRHEAGLSPGQPGILPLRLESQSTGRTGERGERSAGSGQISSVRREEIRCLNPQTLRARGDQEVTRRRVYRYFHSSRLSGPSVTVARIPKIVRAPQSSRRVTLHVRVERGKGEPGEILPPDAMAIREKPWLPPGKGSHPREAKA